MTRNFFLSASNWVDLSVQIGCVDRLHWYRMEKMLQALHKDGVLHPFEAQPLEENQQVTLTIIEPMTAGQDIAMITVVPRLWSASQETRISRSG